MSSEGPLSAGAGANNASVGTVAWSNPGNITSADLVRASADVSSLNLSNYLKATNFGFAIPAGATIDGIVFEARLRGSAYDYSVRAVKAGSIVGDDKASGTQWPTFSDQYRTYGGSSDLWGQTWTAEDVNASDFGIVISCQDGIGAPFQFGYVDHVRATVYYTPAVVAPVADFSGTPTSGASPLSVTFTDASANTPTSWLWEKSSDGGSSWAYFDSGPTSQNPTESFAEGTWAVRLTSTNAGGSDGETKLAYITVTSAASPCIYAIEGGDCIYKPANSSLECIYDNGGGCLLSNSRHKE